MKKTSIALLIFGLLLPILFAGCESEPTEVDDYTAEPVLQAYLTTGETFGEVYLQRVVTNLTAPYDPQDHGILEADVRIFAQYDQINQQPLDPDQTLVMYDDDPAYLGRYIPTIVDTVRPGWMYRIEIRFNPTSVEPDLWAETTAPDTFSFTSNYPELNAHIDIEPDSIEQVRDPAQFPQFNRDMDVISIDWSSSWLRNNVPVINPIGGMFMSITALTDTSELTPLDPDWDPNDPDDELEPEDMWRVAWTPAPDYQNSMSVVWAFFSWEGPTRLDLIAQSNEFYRYSFTQLIASQGPGSNVRIESNVQGGLGCFGATFKRSVYINMVRLEN